MSYLSRHLTSPDDVRRAVEGRVPLVISGHVHWSEPLAELAAPTRALNVDGRAVLLRRAD